MFRTLEQIEIYNFSKRHRNMEPARSIQISGLIADCAFQDISRHLFRYF